MIISVNKKDIEVDDNITIESMLFFLGIKTEFIAVEVNSTIVPKSEFAIHMLSENDKITIINAVGGG
jgi:sulfur carrier protein